MTAAQPDMLGSAAPVPRRLRRYILPVLAILTGFLIALIFWLVLTAPLGRALEPAIKPALVLTDSGGRPIARRGDYKEAPVDLGELPAYVPAALIAIEDRRFYRHFGVDPRGIARALSRNIAAGGVMEGGSTLTQQLAKTSFLSADRSIVRKLQEVVIAVWLETRLSKDEILERYLSSVYFGDGAYGIRAAARVYFATSPERLTLGEAAMLAGLVQAPSRLAPSRHLEAARQRGRLVLAAMVDTGAISAARAKAARPARYTPGRRSLPTGSYFADWALPQARAAQSGPGYGDVIVTTTLDRDLQSAAEAAVRDSMAASKGLGLTQAALVAMRPDGRVVAMVGGTDYATTPFNRATQAMRQPGSSWKLFVYLAALDDGMRPGDIVDDAPIVIGDYAPRNDDGKYRGRISLATAFAASSNNVAVQLAQQTGTAAVIAQARKLGITAPISEYPAMALGTSPVTLLEMTQAYAALASGRRPIAATALIAAPPSGFLGTVRNAAAALTPWPSQAPMRELLASVIRNGTGNAARLPVPAFGKTGTTQNHRDALFIGFAGDLVVGVWVGNDDNSPMNGVVGGGVPARLWRSFMLSALLQDRPRQRSRPQADAIGDLVEVIAGPEAGDAAGAVAGVVLDASEGERDPQGVLDAASEVEDTSNVPPDPPSEPPPL